MSDTRKKPTLTSLSGEKSPEIADSELPFYDLTCEICPLTFVRAKLYLEDLVPGERIGLLLKEGSQMRFIPPNLESEGHTIESIQASDGVFRLVVRKGVVAHSIL